ncbi:MAG: hypothetical protein Q8911_05380 [Bacillota bacterium]|nr:hypothetical protein [Bacillota bacterium]
MKAQYKISILLMIILVLLFPGLALADELSSQFGGNTPLVVPAGHTVESVFAVSTDAHIAGSVKDVVLVINGDVYLEPTAQTDLVIDLGGQVINPSNIPVPTGVFRLTFTPKFTNELMIGGAMILCLWLVRLILSVFAIVLFTGLGYLLRNRIQQGVTLLAASPIKILSIGAAASLIILGLILILSLTVIGIPVAMLIALIATIAALLGMLPLLEYMGQHLLSTRLFEYPALSRWFLTVLVFVSVLNLPLMGLMVLLGAIFTGMGVSTVSCWAYYKERKHRL